MKKAQREVYLVLIKEVNWQLCSFCQFSESLGPCEGIGCNHPLEERIPGYEDALEPGSDCWAFRPSNTVSFIADIVGIVLEQGWEEVIWWEDEGVLKIAGRA